VVRVALPQSDGRHKPRPGVLIAAFPPFGDWLVVGISGSVGLAVPDLDIVIDQGHPAFASARLGFPGVIRLGHAHVVPVTWIEGRIGRIDPDTLRQVRERLATWILQHA
jgi:hypothetical protein